MTRYCARDLHRTHARRRAARRADLRRARRSGAASRALGGKLIDALSGRSEIVADLAAAPALAGKHNAQNAAAAYAAARALGVDPRIIAQALTTFAGLAASAGARRRHRRRALHQRLQSHQRQRRRASARGLSARLLDRRRRRQGGRHRRSRAILPAHRASAYLIGQSAGDFADALRGKAPVDDGGRSRSAVKLAFADARASGEPHPVVLLSPACASLRSVQELRRARRRSSRAYRRRAWRSARSQRASRRQGVSAASPSASARRSIARAPMIARC